MENSNIHSQKRQRTETTTRSAKLKNLDVLDCPVCYERLTIPTFQCENGHLVCSICLAKVKNKCPGPACKLRIGNKRCFSMEKVLESVLVQCQNAKFGCPQSFTYKDQVNLLNHEKGCKYLKCACPKLDCNFTGSSRKVSYHFYCTHFKDSSNVYFDLDKSFDAKININDKILVLVEKTEMLLFVVECFREDHGVYVTIRRLLSSSASSDLEEFRYRLAYKVDGNILIYESPEVKRFLKATSQKPGDNFMLVPNSFLRGEMLEIRFGIESIKK